MKWRRIGLPPGIQLVEVRQDGVAGHGHCAARTDRRRMKKEKKRNSNPWLIKVRI
jgi:hypothetical protein